MIRQSSNMRAAMAKLAEIGSEVEQECFALGYDAAHGIVCQCSLRMGDTVVIPDETESVLVDQDNYLDVLRQLAYAAESHARQFSPWEQTAARINSIDPEDSLHYWNLYDEGVALAIEHDMEGLENGVH